MSTALAKRRKQQDYAADGMQRVSLQTLRRRQSNVKKARTAEFFGMYHDGDHERPMQENIANAIPPKTYASYVEGHEGEIRMSLLSIFEESDVSSETEEPTVSSATNLDVTVMPVNDEALYNNDAEYSESLYEDDVDFESNNALPEELSFQESLLPNVGGPSCTDSDREGFNVEQLKDYIHTGGDTVMFKESNLKTWQVVLVILGLCTRFSLSNKARRALIEATKLFAGPRFSSWNISDYYLSKVFDPPDEVILYYFYCQVCYKQLGKPVTKGQLRIHEAVCNTCLQTYTLSAESPNYFISLDLKYQLISLLSSTTGKDNIANLLVNTDTETRFDGTIRDVYDGLLYKRLIQETPNNSKLLTYVFNTDGAPLFESSKRAFWPILLILNELPPEVRFRYPLLVGLLVVRKEPSPDLMNTYMESFVRQANTLSTDGFHMRVGDKDIHFVLKPLACSVDSVARPLLQNRLQYNGYYGCSWCYCMGVHKHGCMRFLLEEIEPLDRTHNEYMADMEAATQKNNSCDKKTNKKINIRGVKGKAILTKLEGLDMIWAFVRDYLHADLIGCVLQMWSMWCDPKCPIHLNKAQQDIVNSRVMNMTPPQEIHRLVRPLKSEKCKWKASEWRSWLLFYAIPCLTGVLDNYALQHFSLYVNSIHTLLKNSITEQDLDKAEYDLHQFVMTFEIPYSEKYVTFNIHSLKHLVTCVRHCGPLWATSTFPFESTIHTLKQFVHGPSGVYEQMARKSIQINIFRSLVSEMEENPASLAFYQSLFGRYEVASFRRSGTVLLIGNGRPCRHENRLFQFVESDILTYQRCIFSRMVINSALYTRANKSNNTTFIVRGGKVVKVLNLLYYNGTAFAEVACYKVTKVTLPCSVQEEDNRKHFPVIENSVVNHLYRLNSRISDKIIRVQDILEKCVVINIDNKTYISRLPNTVEIQ